ncbi:MULTISPECIES: serine hydrolase [Okeania]|uniref:Beta-lactamase class A catalytic domain-containing protein n=1 Tax=Okeania hirsuta TaxID=1458930 RepID=A0A3N6P3Q4_9CYAN|nr:MULTISPECIES: serine hydrolase [Okeania]NEP05044.1 serine hydrolase [Okeania sp. SIO4D6]NET12636.1 serine hydrolase [Okeania sp. SIO1H6]NEP73821.1 serine hydrolase [Okeania sp. SIO2G5]NEP95224.1 serine hydrolase [Okeania sp. SIO2F5]NEQ91460.1 serine hydrolase [Okeania sp. SIO2G4]
MTFFDRDEQLNILGKDIIEAIKIEFSELTYEQIAITWLVYDLPMAGNIKNSTEFWQQQVRGWSDHGDERMYAAGIVHLFYLIAIYEWLEKGMVKTSKELERAIRDMIVYSSNDATGLVVDVLTGTTSGPEISSGPFQTWKYQRNFVNRYFQSLKWPELKFININQKTWCDGPYGRERMFQGLLMENRNIVTTHSTARLLHSIVGGVAVSPVASQKMMNLLKKNPSQDKLRDRSKEQSIGFLDDSLPQDTKVWCKGSSDNQVRHNFAYIELPNIKPYLLVVFTEGKNLSQNEKIMPYISQRFVEAMKKLQ